MQDTLTVLNRTLLPTLAQWIGLLLLALLIAFHGPVAAQSEPPKFALLIGNSNYQSDKRSLKNPVNDAKLLAQSLQRLGFTVRVMANLDKTSMMTAVTEFSAQVPEGATLLVFYAGHGMQIGGESYLIPVDMAIASEQSVALRAYPLRKLLEQVSVSKSSVNIVILDACRDNPFQPAPAVRYRSLRDLGLGPVIAPRGTFVAYSTSPGQLAADGTEANSVYTATLASAILEPLVSLENIFKKVGNRVRKKTLDDQIPWVHSSLDDDFYFLPPTGIKVAAGRPLQSDSNKKTGGTKRQVDTSNPAGDNSSTEVSWYRAMGDYEWSSLDNDIGQRVKYMTEDEIPMMEHRANGGSVVAQTTLGLFWLEGSMRITTSGTGQVQRYQPNNTEAVRWLRMAANAGFPIAQVELAEMMYQGRGIDKDTRQARQLFQTAAEAHYPRAKIDLAQIDLQEGKLNVNSLKDIYESMRRGMPIMPGVVR